MADNQRMGVQFAQEAHHSKALQPNDNIPNGISGFVEAHVIKMVGDYAEEKIEDEVKSFIPDNRELLSDILVLYALVQHYQQEVLNLFDNYVCFYQEMDVLQFQKLASKAESRVKVMLENEKLKHYSLARQLLKMSCNILNSHYTAENRQIVEFEKELADICGKELLDSYELKVNQYLQKQQIETSLDQNQLIAYCVQILDKSLNFGAKMNRVHTKMVDFVEKKIVEDLGKRSEESSFQNLESNIIEPKNKVIQSTGTVTKPKTKMTEPVPPESTVKNALRKSTVTEKETRSEVSMTSESSIRSQSTFRKASNQTETEASLETGISSTGMIISQVSAFSEYLKAVNNEIENLQDINFACLENLHIKSRSSVVAKVDESIATQIHENVDRYFYFHLLNIHEQSLTCVTGLQKCIGLYLTLTENFYTFTLSNGKTQICSVDLENTFAWKFAAGENPVTIANLLQTLRDSSINSQKRKKGTDIISNSLKSLKTKVTSDVGQVGAIVLVVPAWFTVSELSLLRNATNDAEFKNMIMIRENALVALTSMKRLKNAYTVFVVINTKPSRITLDIYLKSGRGGITLQASAFADLNESQMKNLLGPHLLKEYLQILHRLFVVASNHVDTQRKNGSKACFLTAEGKIWTDVYQRFLKTESTLKDMKVPCMQDLMSTLSDLTKDTTKISEVVVDHSIRDDAITMVLQNRLVNKSAHEGQFKDTTDKPISRDINAGLCKAQRDNIIHKCNIIRNHVEKNNIRLGSIRGKYLSKSLDSAEAVAGNADSTEEDLREANAKADELMNNYKIVGKA